MPFAKIEHPIEGLKLASRPRAEVCTGHADVLPKPSLRPAKTSLGVSGRLQGKWRVEDGGWQALRLSAAGRD